MHLEVDVQDIPDLLELGLTDLRGGLGLSPRGVSDYTDDGTDPVRPPAPPAVVNDRPFLAAIARYARIVGAQSGKVQANLFLIASLLIYYFLL